MKKNFGHYGGMSDVSHLTNAFIHGLNFGMNLKNNLREAPFYFVNFVVNFTWPHLQFE